MSRALRTLACLSSAPFLFLAAWYAGLALFGSVAEVTWRRRG